MGAIGTIDGSTVRFGHDFALSPGFPPVVGQDPLVGRYWMGIRDQVVSVLTEIVRHRQLGSDLVYDAYNIDIDAAD